MKNTQLKGKPAFETSELIQVWIVHHLQILGEAARGISEESRRKYPNIPWSKIVGFRNIPVHHYFAIDPLELWRVVVVDIPPLKKEIGRILEK
ncbi:MAG: HepT-like ribonuclease domain-containing protein [Methanoregula sp.]